MAWEKLEPSGRPLLEAYKAQLVSIPAGKLLRRTGMMSVLRERPAKGIVARLTGKTEVITAEEPILSEVATIPAFQMGRTPVTVGMWQEFCGATHREMQAPPDHPVWGSGWDAVRDHPIVRVTWEDCQAYADWAGLVLPTAAQWEYAASGGDGRVYPWGDDWDASKCQCSKKSRVDSGGTSRVGSFPAGPFGLYDMAGNVFEWSADWYDDTKTFRCLHGGAWGHSAREEFCCAYRGRMVPTMWSFFWGFRLANLPHISR
ncbi:formylglycine-generating enzyme family protein [Armatimonas rosea]|uniref:Formylglycine-generating enzyme required for sulfatase activity n=1 Tax=Armatimonas rosea TaxID=685828 RepID=A0A7W9W958_ARMRO|nr:SUMF1/EgtB/PvdO family nonheme iron enzyme [Armatimonas rosea]MBB6053508.1 formylglycine-generating enzyme required for sulfatase activity [Armatimonas rosea]